MATMFPEAGMKYWDDFEQRARETVSAVSVGLTPPLRRVSVHITNACNFGCEYCNEVHCKKTLSFTTFATLAKEYSAMGGGIIHVTGGEPTVVRDFPAYIREVMKYANVSFHLNTNLYSSVMTDDLFGGIARLKVSLDSAEAKYFNDLVRRKQAYEIVTGNLDRVHQLLADGKINTVVSLTYTVTKENYKRIPEFLEMYETRWPLFYACFFSSYKGTNDRFVLTPADTDMLFSEIVPQINRITEQYQDTETKCLFHASHEARTFHVLTRFPEVNTTPCYLQLSELVVDEDGYLSNCSHLFRDNVPNSGMRLGDGNLADLFRAMKQAKHATPMAHACLYGCNKKLTTFNQIVSDQLKEIG